jgi:ABC-2 type transport system permease protein
MFALFGIVAMAVVTSTADYGTGGIVATLQWTPRRVVLLTARTGVILATTTVLGLGLVTRNTAAALVIALALILIAPLLLAQLPYDWTLTAATHLPGSGALFLVFGEGPSDDMTTTSARLTLAAWAVAALTAGGWRLLQSDANR